MRSVADLVSTGRSGIVEVLDVPVVAVLNVDCERRLKSAVLDASCNIE